MIPKGKLTEFRGEATPAEFRHAQLELWPGHQGDVATVHCSRTLIGPIRKM